MHGMTVAGLIPAVDKKLAAISQMLLACMICMGVKLNGAWIGSRWILELVLYQIRKARIRDIRAVASCAAGVHGMTMAMVATTKLLGHVVRQLDIFTPTVTRGGRIILLPNIDMLVAALSRFRRRSEVLLFPLFV